MLSISSPERASVCCVSEIRVDSLTVVSMVSYSTAGRLRARSLVTFRQDRHAGDERSPACRREPASRLHVGADVDAERGACYAARCRVCVLFPALPGRQRDCREECGGIKGVRCTSKMDARSSPLRALRMGQRTERRATAWGRRARLGAHTERPAVACGGLFGERVVSSSAPLGDLEAVSFSRPWLSYLVTRIAPYLWDLQRQNVLHASKPEAGSRATEAQKDKMPPS